MTDVRRACGCWFEDVRDRAFSLREAEPMPPHAEFTDDCSHILHYCTEHWEKTHGQEG